MKKTIVIAVLLTTILLLVFAIGCNQKEGEVVIKIEKGYDLDKGDFLIDYMEYLKSKGRLDYSLKSGMITEINGLENQLNSYWMLYTNDPNFSNSAWGTYEYKGDKLGSATLGANELKINKDYVYVWVYERF